MFGSASVILMIVVSELWQPLPAVVAVGLSWGIGWALDGVLDSYQAARHEHGGQEERLQRWAVLDNLPNDLDGFGS